MNKRRIFLKYLGAGTSLGSVFASHLMASIGFAQTTSSPTKRHMVWGGTVPLKLDPHDVIDVPTFFFKNNNLF